MKKIQRFTGEIVEVEDEYTLSEGEVEVKDAEEVNEKEEDPDVPPEEKEEDEE